MNFNRLMNRIQKFIQAHDFPCWCGQRAARLVCRQMLLGRRFAVLECAACQTQRILPKALNEQSSAATLYNEYAGQYFTDVAPKQFIGSMLRRLEQTGVLFGPGKRVLDVGCGSGLLLETICERYRCTGRGIDVDRRRIDKARTRACHAVFECGLFDVTRLDQKYDILLSTAVIEHVVNPSAFLKQFQPALEDDGSLFLLTPNARSLNYRLLRSWWRELLSIGEHIYLFTPESLELCANRAGFRLVQCSSDFDRASLRLRTGGLRNWLISLWSFYCEGVKRVSGVLATPRRGDILFAHFKKEKTR